MKEQQEYVEWQPIEAPGTLYVEALIDDWEGFRILLRSDQNSRVIRISFDSYIAYQNRDETHAYGEIRRSKRTVSSQLYVVHNSEFALRIQEDSTMPRSGIKHFSIITSMDFIDILSVSEPRIEYL
jgi:hypothetical protein